jgi:hypothetical protein
MPRPQLRIIHGGHLEARESSGEIMLAGVLLTLIGFVAGFALGWVCSSHF